MSDRESKACENYQAFNLLRSRFGGTKKPPASPQRNEKRKRRDPRFDAPPLKALVEETDLLAVPASTVNVVASQCNRKERVEGDNSSSSSNRNQKSSPNK
jgi:hypothetical protein